MDSIFGQYDIRGIYGTALTEEIAGNIGRAFVTYTQCKQVVVGRDVREHSPKLYDELKKGIMEMGADVVDLGEVSTPMLYFGCGTLGGAGIMITASHNTKEYNGFKLCAEGVIPISGVTGLKETKKDPSNSIERIVEDKAFRKVAENRGAERPAPIEDAYRAYVQKAAKKWKRPVRIAADMANGMGIAEAKALKGLDIEMDVLFGKPDGKFPNHEGNPLHRETMAELQTKVRDGWHGTLIGGEWVNRCKYDFGVAFDGDADRVGFVDEKGEYISMDLITALIAREILANEKGVVLYDLRSSWAVKEAIEEAGGTAKMCRVGHSFIKAQMLEDKAIFAGELSGHYYFRHEYAEGAPTVMAESSAMAVVMLANIVGNSDEPLSELVKPLRTYFASGEIDSPLKDDAAAEKVMLALEDTYGPKGENGGLSKLDGVRVEFTDWWFSVRCSNTEPKVRLNVEAKSKALMAEKKKELLEKIRG